VIYEAQELTRTHRRGDSTISALENVSLQIDAGEYVAVTGPNGCGKTTLLHVLGLLDPDYDGRLLFCGQRVDGLAQRELARLRLRSIGFAFQSFHLLPMLDVRDNVALPRWRLGGDRRESRARAEQLLRELRLEHRIRHGAHRLSGGEMQRVAIARALVNDPPVILADEPTGNLDAKSTCAILDILAELSRAGRTIVLISHDPEVVSHSKRVVSLRYGKILFDVPVERIQEPQYNPWVTWRGWTPGS
jgi:putative ABC transport system ATP-binding protein